MECGTRLGAGLEGGGVDAGQDAAFLRRQRPQRLLPLLRNAISICQLWSGVSRTQLRATSIYEAVCSCEGKAPQTGAYRFMPDLTSFRPSCSEHTDSCRPPGARATAGSIQTASKKYLVEGDGQGPGAGWAGGTGLRRRAVHVLLNAPPAEGVATARLHRVLQTHEMANVAPYMV